MSLQLQRNDSWSMFGDSITNGSTEGPWFPTFQASVSASYQRAAAPVTAAHVGTLTNAPVAGPVMSDPIYGPVNFAPAPVYNNGVGGNKVSDLTARVATVIAEAPTVVFIEAGVNDVINATNITTFGNNCNNLAAAIVAGLPTARIAWLNIFCYGEQFPDPGNATINAYNAKIQTTCATYGITYIDNRTIQQAYEQANNTPSPGAIGGVMCADNPGVHPNVGVGIPAICTNVLANCTLNNVP